MQRVQLIKYIVVEFLINFSDHVSTRVIQSVIVHVLAHVLLVLVCPLPEIYFAHDVAQAVGEPVILWHRCLVHVLVIAAWEGLFFDLVHKLEENQIIDFGEVLIIVSEVVAFVGQHDVEELEGVVAERVDVEVVEAIFHAFVNDYEDGVDPVLVVLVAINLRVAVFYEGCFVETSWVGDLAS